MFRDELSREAFAELVVIELMKQGVRERGAKVTANGESTSGGGSLLSNTSWSAQRTHRALTFDQPRAPAGGLKALAVAIEKKAATEESKEETSVEDDHWLIVDKTFLDGVCAIATSSPSAEAARLASSLFVDCAHVLLFGRSGSQNWTHVDAPTLCSLVNGSFVKDLAPDDPNTWTLRVSEIMLELERQDKKESWRQYAHLLREVATTFARVSQTSSGDAFKFACVLTALGKVAPGSDALLPDYWDNIAGLGRDIRGFSAAFRKLAVQATLQLPRVSEFLNQPDVTAAGAASALMIAELVLSAETETSHQAVFGAGIVRYATVAFANRTFGDNDLFLSKFLLRTTWYSPKAAEFMLAIDDFRQRVLAKVDPPNSSPSERALWAISLAATVPLKSPYRAEAENCAMERLTELNVRNAQSFIAYLNQNHRCLVVLRQWAHLPVLIKTVEGLRPEKPKNEDHQTKDGVEDDFARLHAAYKRVIGSLRGSGGVD